MKHQIVHAIEGRIRVRIPQLASDPEYAGKLQSLIEARKSITSVRINPQAQSIVIAYKAKAISLEAMQAQIEQAIEQLSPPPAPVVPPPAANAEPAVPLEPDPWEDRAIAPLAAVDLADPIAAPQPQPAEETVVFPPPELLEQPAIAPPPLDRSAQTVEESENQPDRVTEPDAAPQLPDRPDEVDLIRNSPKAQQRARSTPQRQAKSKSQRRSANSG